MTCRSSALIEPFVNNGGGFPLAAFFKSRTMQELFVPVFAEPSEGGTIYPLLRYACSSHEEAVALGDFYNREVGYLVGIFKLVEVDKDGKEIAF